MTDLIARPRRRKSPALRAMFEETTLTLNDLVLPIFVEEEIDDYKAIEAMPGVMRIPEKYLAREIEHRHAGIRSVMTFGISHIPTPPAATRGKKMASSPACPHLQRDGAGNGGDVRHLFL
jgi:delta-aminolevulinic acid dehydratase/porphobilinogen synthase